MKYIEDMELDNKKVILRLDLNVTIKNNEIVDDTKIKKSIPTIKYLLNKNCHILMMSHLGKVKTEEDKQTNSLRMVCDRLSTLLGEDVLFIPNTESDELIHSLDNNKLVLMENTRFEDVPDKRESGCDMSLASYWAQAGEVFINDAFGTSHRKHASNYGLSKCLPSAYGFLIKEELVGLDPVVNNIEHPFTVIMGGAKVDDKVQLIESLLKECDHLVVGGGIANTFLKASNINIGASLYSEAFVDNVAGLINRYKDKVLMPVDVVVEENGVVKEIPLEEITDASVIYDIGSKTVESYASVLMDSKTVFVNGTMGMYENEAYRAGTEELYKVLDKVDATIVAGGGDAVSSVNKLGFQSTFDFLSTGGGATLDYIASKALNCFED